MISWLRNLVALPCILMLVLQDLSADSFRCGRKLVGVGDSAGELLRACGEPDFKDRGKSHVRVSGVSKEVSVQHWYYKKSSRSLEHIIVVYKGRVAGVEVGHRY